MFLHNAFVLLLCLKIHRLNKLISYFFVFLFSLKLELIFLINLLFKALFKGLVLKLLLVPLLFGCRLWTLGITEIPLDVRDQFLVSVVLFFLDLLLDCSFVVCQVGFLKLCLCLITSFSRLIVEKFVHESALLCNFLFAFELIFQSLDKGTHGFDVGLRICFQNFTDFLFQSSSFKLRVMIQYSFCSESFQSIILSLTFQTKYFTSLRFSIENARFLLQSRGLNY